MNNILSLIIPVYKNEESIPELLHVLEDLNKELNKHLEVVFVIDGSPDRCYEILLNSLKEATFRSKLILLSRNFGAFSAVRAGMKAGTGEHFAIMAADLQEPPSLVKQMDCILQQEDVDVVIGVRTRRKDPFFSQLASQIFWGIYRHFVIPDIPPGGVDIFACDKAFRDQLLQLEERHSSLIAQIFWLGYRRKFLPYERQERKYGKSAWSLNKRINYLMDSIFSFTDLPIRLLMRVGAVTASLSGIFGMIVVVSRMFGLILVPGYAATVLAIIFFGAFNLFALGIVGSYAWRTYENTKARPLHIVLRSHTFASQEDNK